MTTEVLIIGAGPAGLAAAYELKQLGIRPRIIDQAEQIGVPWRNRHDQLQLNTHRDLSDLPGLKMPRDYPAFPSRDQFVAYLEQYLAFLDLPIEFGNGAKRIEKDPQGAWRVDTDRETITARHVIIATGSDRDPVVPAWPGREFYRGEIIHAGQFRHARDYAGKSVLLVGPGNSGMDIGNHLVKEAIKPSWLSVRGGTWVAPKYLLGIPLQPLAVYGRFLPIKALDRLVSLMTRLFYGDLRTYGLPIPTKGAATRNLEENVVPSLDDGFMAALKKGLFKVVPEIRRFTEEHVELVDGTVLQPDAVICATGYRLGLEPLVGHLGVLNTRGFPRYWADQSSPEYPGLWFFGLNTSIFGNFYVRRAESKRLAAHIRDSLPAP